MPVDAQSPRIHKRRRAALDKIVDIALHELALQRAVPVTEFRCLRSGMQGTLSVCNKLEVRAGQVCVHLTSVTLPLLRGTGRSTFSRAEPSTGARYVFPM